jgi:hypothetical protein
MKISPPSRLRWIFVRIRHLDLPTGTAFATAVELTQNSAKSPIFLVGRCSIALVICTTRIDTFWPARVLVGSNA